MSGHHPPNILEQGVGGAGPPPEDPMATQTPTQTTFGAPMGHAAQFTPPQQYPYGYHMHMPMMPAHQTNQQTPMGFYAPYPVNQMPPRMQAGPTPDDDEIQTSPTFRLGAGSKRLRQDDTPGGHQRFRTTHRQSQQPPMRFNDDVFNTQQPDNATNRINNILDRLENLINDTPVENVSQSAKDRIQALSNRLNGNDINKTLGKITEVLEKLTT